MDYQNHPKAKMTTDGLLGTKADAQWTYCGIVNIIVPSWFKLCQNPYYPFEVIADHTLQRLAHREDGSTAVDHALPGVGRKWEN